MARTIYKEGQGFGQSEVLGTDEQFTEEAVRRAALALLVGPAAMIDDATVIVSAEWERKGYTQRGPIDEKNPSYRPSPERDDLIVSIELRLSDWMRESEPARELQAEVRKIIKQREQVRLANQIEELEAQEVAARAALEIAQTRLVALRGE